MPREGAHVIGLIAETPALPLHTAGKYVAAAYIVLFAMVLVYVAIMAIRMSRIERELGELLAQLDGEAAGRGRRHVSELLALGISHKTAPVSLRERLAFSESEAEEFARVAVATESVREAVVISTCNRTEVYLVVGDPVQAEGDVLGLLARRAGIRPTELAAVDLLAAQLRRRAPALPRDRRARVDDRRRGRDPGPGPPRPRGRDARRGHRAAHQPPVRGGAARRQARALRDRDRRKPRERAVGRRRPRAERARRPARAATS